MQRGLQLLQAPLMELRGLVAAELSANPMLEEVPLVSNNLEEPTPEEALSGSKEEPSPWEEALQFSSNSEEERQRSFLESRPSRSTLAEVVRAQSAAFSSKEQPIVEAIIGNLDMWGYFRINTAELASEMHISEAAVEEVLGKVQQLDPPGVAARDLKECLLLQLERQGKGSSLASRIVRHYLPQLARHDYQGIAKALHLELEEIRKAQKEIAKLEPHPGRPYFAIEEGSMVPDVIVIAESENEFVVRLNEEGLSRVRLNDQYKELLATHSDQSELRHYLKTKIQEARSFIHHLEQRHDTLLRVSKEIVRQQHDFFKHGTYGLHSLTMAQVATALGLHPTTISRAIVGKTMETSYGLFPLKYFFTASFENSSGKEMSSEAVKTLLQQWIDKEDKNTPLSDQAIVGRFQEEGITVARRTIAHYRDELKILPKNLRKIC